MTCGVMADLVTANGIELWGFYRHLVQQGLKLPMQSDLKLPVIEGAAIAVCSGTRTGTRAIDLTDTAEHICSCIYTSIYDPSSMPGVP